MSGESSRPLRLCGMVSVKYLGAMRYSCLQRTNKVDVKVRA
jgi:hypothetical protein